MKNLSESLEDDSIVVIGSGPPGAAAALFLTNAGLKVTLLEAGPAQTARGLTVRVAGYTVARIHRELPLRSDIQVSGDPGSLLYEDVSPGGLTNHWSCAVPRFSPDDFQDAERAGAAYRWPIAYDDLVTWYEWVEPLLRIAGSGVSVPQLPGGTVRSRRTLGETWTNIAEHAAREGQGVTPVPYVYGAETTVTFSGTVFNSFVRLVQPALRSGHLAVRCGAPVERLEWSGARRRVDAVVVRDASTGSHQRIPCRAVVVAAGAVNTAKILLQSTSPDFPQGLGNTHGVLGRYLHDHPLGKVEIQVAKPIGFQPAAYVTRSPLHRNAPLYAASCLQWSGMGLLARSIAAGHPGRATSCGFNVFGTMAPSRDNYVALDDASKLILNIRFPPEATTTLEAARDQLLHLLDTAGYRPRRTLWVVGSAGTAVHFAGTCRMHASPEFGMIDAWSRMHAVPNVAVVDSSAFTTGPEKNPVLTAMALAARASHKLVEDLRTGVI